ncbi:hypothetical protein BJ912DRAFT_1069792 [Pholiota molesta]|nr:hypothetical protein BJ912DRAFT_1069792 [Pholiota molesta]
MPQLFSDDEEGVNTNTQLTINEHYAKAFEYRKEREELERLKAKYGSDYDPDASGSDLSTDSESAESEDEHGEELTPAVDAAILRTLARIKKKDPAIYDSDKNIFGEEQEKIGTNGTTQTKTKTKSKPVTLRQVNMDAMLHGSRSPSPENDETRPLTHVEEQEALRRETIAAFHGAAAQIGDDDILIPREKTQDEREREEEEYRAFLEREVGDLKELVTVDVNDDDEGEIKADEEQEEEEGDADQEDITTEKKKKKKKKKSKKTAEEPVKKTKAEQDQEFLLNYILNRGWIDRSEGHVPTYSEGDAADDDAEMDTGLLSDTSFESLASHFETSYNHRFEEPGAADHPRLPAHPRLRRAPAGHYPQGRPRAPPARKEEELQKRREEVKRMKALKMREVKRKLALIGRQGGLKAGVGRAKRAEGDAFVDEALRSWI